MKLDIGCGNKKREGFTGVDQYPMEGVDVVLNVAEAKWPWDEGSVEEIHAAHFLEHLTPKQRIHFMNEAHRVLQPGGKALIVTPHWCNYRAYGDMTHQWPPVSEMFYFYLNRDWRRAQAPHTDKEFNPEGFECDFNYSLGYSFSDELKTRDQEYVLHALANFKDAAQDMLATLVKPSPQA